GDPESSAHRDGAPLAPPPGERKSERDPTEQQDTRIRLDGERGPRREPRRHQRSFIRPARSRSGGDLREERERRDEPTRVRDVEVGAEAHRDGKREGDGGEGHPGGPPPAGGPRGG